MKIMVTGRSGQVGWELERQLQPLGQRVLVKRVQAASSVKANRPPSLGDCQLPVSCWSSARALKMRRSPAYTPDTAAPVCVSRIG